LSTPTLWLTFPHLQPLQVTNPRWSAPEVIRSSTVSRPADVFSFGVVMWELLTWQQPYEEMMSVQVRAQHTHCLHIIDGIVAF
jgi:serine/threonine protein kinase